MSRRGEGQFVAMEVNLRNDPKVLGMARRLRMSRDEAVGKLAAWREFVLTKGEGSSGVVRGYSKDDVATWLDWPKRPAILIDALKTAGFLVVRRGSLAYPGWLETPTGYYAHRRAADRERQARRWAEKGEGGSGDSAESPRSLHGDSTESRSRSGHQSSKDPPGAPPGGVGVTADALSEEFLETYPRVRNPKKCRRIIGAMDPPEIAQLRYALPLHVRIYEEKKKGKGWRFVPCADSYLEDGTYWEFRPPKPKATNGHQVDPEETKRREAEERAKYEHARQMLERRAVIRARLKAEGVPRHELEERIDDELAKELPS